MSLLEIPDVLWRPTPKDLASFLCELDIREDNVTAIAVVMRTVPADKLLRLQQVHISVTTGVGDSIDRMSLALRDPAAVNEFELHEFGAGSMGTTGQIGASTTRSFSVNLDWLIAPNWQLMFRRTAGVGTPIVDWRYLGWIIPSGNIR